MGSCYEYRPWDKEDRLETIKWYRMAAEQEDAEAEERLGHMYEEGWGVRQDYAEALRWYLKAAAQGHSGAEKSIGSMYSHGLGVARNDEEAMRWFVKSAERADLDVRIVLGRLCPRGNDSRNQYLLYRIVQMKGCSSAEEEIGDMYRNGAGVSIDYAEALRWYLRAWEHRNYGYMPQPGYREFSGLLLKAAEDGDARAQFRLGLEYEDDKNCGEALKWYRKAAEQGNAAAQYKLGNMYEFGHGVETNKAEALQWYLSSAGQGYSMALSEFTDSDLPESYLRLRLEFLRNASEEGSAFAMDLLGSIYENRQKDCWEALKWYRRGAELGNAAAQFDLGRMYKYGIGTERNCAEALRWFRKAARQGNADAVAEIL